MEKKSKNSAMAPLSWSVFVILIQRWNVPTFSEWIWVSWIEFDPIQVLWIRSDPIQVLSARSDPVLSTAVTYSFQKLVAGVYASCKRYGRVVTVPVPKKKAFRVTLAVLESAISTQKLSFVDFLSARAIVYLISILNMDHLPSPSLFSGNWLAQRD